MRIVLPLLAVLALSGCSTQKDFQEAERASDEFHLQMARGNYGGIYDATGAPFKAATSRDLLIGMLQRVNRKLGACGSAERQGFNVNYNTGGSFVTMAYTRKCANGPLEESFTWRIESGKAVLYGYHANSPVLATD
jgi:hypothetical protein